MRKASAGKVRLLIVVMAVLAGVVAAGAVPSSGNTSSTPNLTVTDGSNSQNAAVLFDGTVGHQDQFSWWNAQNPWSEQSYPMEAVVDLGQLLNLDDLRYYGGQIPNQAQAELRFEASITGAADSYVPLSTVTNPPFDRWSEPVPLGGTTARYVKVSFASMSSRFNVSELQFNGSPTQPVTTTTTVAPGNPGQTGTVAGVSVADGANSANASRLVDGAEPYGTDDQSSWENPNRWAAGAYPMNAVFDLGGQYPLSALEYFVGNINQGSDRVRFEYSPNETGDDFTSLVTVDDGHDWGAWRQVPLSGQSARRVRISFDDPWAQFNISEVRFLTGSGGTTTTTTVPETTTTTAPVPTTTVPGETTTTTDQVTTTTTEPGATTTTITPVPVTPGDQPQAGPPPAGVVRSHGFGNWPNGHLTDSCIALHDSYWTTGPNPGVSTDPTHPENLAYHTWHPALAVHPVTGERCDFGHEHGYNPTLAPADLFELSGGWPAFGYVANTLGGARHEDHVGHKVTVARFRASIGNGAGSEPLYDAGFECDWLSKIHQGSSTLDAFANHLHEYFLTLRCMDGLNAQGQVDNTVVGTEFSVKVMYTYGRPNEFVEEGCTSDDPATDRNEQEYPSSILTGPEGQPVMPAMRTDPLGNDKPNSRAFVCSSSVLWKDFSQIQSVDLWTQLIKIQRGSGDTAITIQPYYIVKNPARIVEAYDGNNGEQPSQVIRTISLCYDPAGNRLDRPLCEGAPDQEPDWTSPLSPFNGALRAVNFKASHLQNANGPERFCTDPFGFSVQDALPCDRGNLTQTASQFDNHWNDGRYSFGNNGGNIQGSIWATDPYGRRFAASPMGGGAYQPNGIGFEFIVDNRYPDDDMDGIPDGANIRGQN